MNWEEKYRYRISEDEVMDEDKIGQFLVLHQSEVSNRFKPLLNAYVTDYPILHEAVKEKWKPDNRIAVNFAKYITDTMSGFFIGNPIKVTCESDDVADYVELLRRYSGQDGIDAELAKMCSIYGKAYEMYFVDENSNIGITYLSPINAFMIYGDSLLKPVRYFVHTYKDVDNVVRGSVSDEETVRYFEIKGKLQFVGEAKQHGFDGVPATKFTENEEETGIFEPALSMINAYNKAISEKANDVDYFADAYLKVLGEELDDDDIKHIRDNRIINFGGDSDRLVVEFLEKPNGDTTQENLINRLERLIFNISMVANISDENFGTSSGIALKYKLLAMTNLAKTKERKFKAGMERRYRLIFSNALSKVKPDSWLKLGYIFTPNIPENILEETEIAGNLEGIVSKSTQLQTLSIVDNVQAEIKKIEAENKESDPVINQLFGGGSDDE